MTVTPWEVSGRVDYEKIISQFGAKPIDKNLIEIIEQKTKKKAHHFLRRGIFYVHRDLDELLNGDKKFYLYTGRGPSSDALHFGHLVPLLFTKYLQDAFNVPLVIQLTDDEKFLFKDLTLEQTAKYARDNTRDILALGFNPQLTFIFCNTQYVQQLYPNVLQIQRSINANHMTACFGFTNSDSIGKWAFPPMQMAPSFPTSFVGILPQDVTHCLIPCALDQDPYFRLTRDVASKLGQPKPAVVISKFFPALQGAYSKMSSTSSNVEKQAPTTIFLNQTPKEIAKLVNRYAFSGGRTTVEEHRLLGANLEVCVAYQWLCFFLEDDEKWEQITKDYKSGVMMSGQVKAVLIEVLSNFATEHQQKRAQITDADIDFVMTRRLLST